MSEEELPCLGVTLQTWACNSTQKKLYMKENKLDFQMLWLLRQKVFY